MGPLYCGFIKKKNLNSVNMVILLYILKQDGIPLPALFALHSYRDILLHRVVTVYYIIIISGNLFIKKF